MNRHMASVIGSPVMEILFSDMFGVPLFEFFPGFYCGLLSSYGRLAGEILADEYGWRNMFHCLSRNRLFQVG